MSKPKKPKPVPFVPDILRDAILARIDDQEGMMKLPVLYGVLVPVYEGLELKRQPGKLTIQVEGAHWRLTLDCPGEKITCRIATDSLVTCLEVLNERLANRLVTWAPGYERNKKALPTVDAIIQ